MSTAEAGPGGRAEPSRGRWGVGPTVMTWIGAVLLLAALVAAGLGAASFLSVLPTGIVTSEGEPGPDAVGGGAVPGEREVYAMEGERIVVWEVTARGEDFTVHRDDVQVLGRDGEVPVRAPSVSSTSSRGEVQARAVAEFLVPVEGGYTVVVDGSADSGSGFLLVPGDSFGGFFSGLLSTIALWFVAIGGGIVAVFLLAGGIAWGMLRARASA